MKPLSTKERRHAIDSAVLRAIGDMEYSEPQSRGMIASCARRIFKCSDADVGRSLRRLRRRGLVRTASNRFTTVPGWELA